jgi:hypothetical protein
MLTTKEQIEVFKEGKERYKIYFDTFRCMGMCWALIITLEDRGCDVDIYNIEEFLPTFNHSHVTRLASANGFQQPKEIIALDYWWPILNSDPRLLTFDALIKELEYESRR